MTDANTGFFGELPPFLAFHEFAEPSHYRPLPEGWLVAISDVRGSTEAIRRGRYKEVNAVGVASIVALLNAVKPVQIPYVFGGDGATACVPESSRETAVGALLAARRMAREAFDLDLRVGLVPAATLTAAGHRVLVGRYAPNPWYGQAMFLGDGIGYAERLVKDPDPANPYIIPDRPGDPVGSFEGFECRWNEIPSPHGETISLLVQALSPDDRERSTLYRGILDEIGAIYGSEKEYHPLRPERLTLATSFRTLRTEARIRTAFRGGVSRLLHLLKARLLTAIGRRLMAAGTCTEHTDWGAYKQALIANSDYRKFDEVLRMVIAGTPEQRGRLRRALEAHRDAGRLAFGLHAAPTALITCIISDYDKEHVHFLDGANGGYALAAKEMKAQLSSLALG